MSEPLSEKSRDTIQVTNADNEAIRVLNICNACRYCEGICATFQAMTQYRTFDQHDVDYLANLCHNCTACFHDCQYTPPHDFAVNVPAALTAARMDSYAEFAWPRSFAGAFQRNAIATFLTTALCIALVFATAAALLAPDVLLRTHTGNGSFYAVVPHNVMVAVAGLTSGFSLLAMIIGGLRFWRAGSRQGTSLGWTAFVTATKNVATLKYMDGGHGEGCSTTDDGFSNQRRYYHQLTMWGFVLCFLSTSTATLYHYAFGLIAPYPVFSIPVLLGSVGGLGLLIGPVGLWRLKRLSDPRPMLRLASSMDYAFLASLALVSASGFAVLVLRDTQAMGITLILHLGIVLAFFVMLPYSKFVHALYRFLALLKFADEQSPR